jgi:hypothetical protein
MISVNSSLMTIIISFEIGHLGAFRTIDGMNQRSDELSGLPGNLKFVYIGPIVMGILHLACAI